VMRGGGAAPHHPFAITGVIPNAAKRNEESLPS